MRKVVRRGAGLGVLLVVLVVLYTGLMLAVYIFPDEWVAGKVQGAVAVIDEEVNYWGCYGNYFWHSDFGITDNISDRVIYTSLLRDGRSVVDAAMHTEYARYWHGYAVLLRPLLAVLGISGMRYLNIMLLMGLLLGCYARMRSLLGRRTALTFAAGLLMGFLLIAPFCQHYMAVTSLALLGCYVQLRWPKAVRARLPEFFLILGSLVCFSDLLTFPVLALGYPLLCCQLLGVREDVSARRLWVQTIGLSAAWMVGYALTWVGKGLVGTLLTGQNVLGDIFGQAMWRMTGVPEDGKWYPMTPAGAVQINMETFFTRSNVLLLALLLAWLGVRALRMRTGAKGWLRALPVASVALYPFVWYLAVQNHSNIHYWMTYKLLSVTAFSLCAYLLAVAPEKESIKS
ncbi:MAG TPA: hypothetical protein IAC11_00675 [Candidatus Limiplasma pullicola]|nr:hypothetical protein [Candidatus Limiplasma pullicola]